MITSHKRRQASSPVLPRSDDAASAPRERRLSDKIRAAFHAACDEGAVEIAARLLIQLEGVVKGLTMLSEGIERRRPESLAGPRERIGNLVLWRILASNYDEGPTSLPDTDRP